MGGRHQKVVPIQGQSEESGAVAKDLGENPEERGSDIAERVAADSLAEPLAGIEADNHLLEADIADRKAVAASARNRAAAYRVEPSAVDSGVPVSKRGHQCTTCR